MVTRSDARSPDEGRYEWPYTLKWPLKGNAQRLSMFSCSGAESPAGSHPCDGRIVTEVTRELFPRGVVALVHQRDYYLESSRKN